MGVPVNPNLSSSYVKPTIAVSIDTNAAAGGDAQTASTVLLFGEQLAAGTATLNTVTALNSVTDAVNAYGQASTIVRQMRHALAQSGVPGAVTFKGVGVSEPTGGTAGVAQIVVSISGTNPSAAGGCTVTVGGSESVSVAWTTADTATTIGDALAAALNTMQFEPFGTWTNSTGTVTATANAKGAFVEDHAVRVVYSNQAGVHLGPGSLTFANSPGADGSVTVNCGAVSIVVAIDHTVQTTATLIAAAVEAAINGSDYPLDAGTHSSGVVPLSFAPGHDVRRVSAKLTSITTTTIAITGGGSAQTAGTLVYANTPGAGYPTLTTAIANVRAAGAFGKWVGPWFDATTAGAQFNAISTDGNGGPNQNRGQTLTLCSTGKESDAATFLGTTSPAMNANASNNNNGMRGAVCVSTDAPMPGYVYAAKVAALRASSAPFTNYDGVALTGTSTAPVLLPAPSAVVSFDDSTQNQAIKDGLTPLAVQNGSLCVVFGRTTLSTTTPALWDWCWIDQADAHRADLIARASTTFAGCALIPDGQVPNSRKDVDPQTIRGFLRASLRKWQSEGSYTGAEALAPQCNAQINPSNPTRADAVYPESPKSPMHQLGVVAQATSLPAA